MKATGAAMIVGLMAISVIALIMTHAATRELPIVQAAPPPVINLPEEPISKPVPVVKVVYTQPAKQPSTASRRSSHRSKKQLGVVKIAISVNQQRLFASLSDGSVKEVPCSTADVNKRNKDGSAVTDIFGSFRAIKKDADHWSGEFDCPMPYSIFFTATRAIHATESENYGALGNYPSSHGCVRVSYEDARWLYQHTPLGTPVSVE